MIGKKPWRGGRGNGVGKKEGRDKEGGEGKIENPEGREANEEGERERSQKGRENLEEEGEGRNLDG